MPSGGRFCSGGQPAASHSDMLPQQTGVSFMHRQQVQPAIIIVIMQSHICIIILAQAMSPLVQVTHIPSVVISYLHMPMVMLQDMTIMPFIIIWQLVMPPPSMRQRFCIIAAAISSLAMHRIIIPFFIFSILNVHRGIIIMFILPGWDIIMLLMVGMLIIWSIIMAPFMFFIVMPFMLCHSVLIFHEHIACGMLILQNIGSPERCGKWEIT